MTLPAITSCNSDYLDEKPRTTYTSDEATQSEAGAEAAITGLSRQMQRQFGDLKNGNLNASGETFFANLYGEGLSADANIGEITRYASGACNPTAFRNLQGWWAAWMYEYAYSIIRSANNILGAMPETNLTDSQYWMKGCALTMRSHAYFRIMQVYAPRWADSKNGEAYCIVLRVKPNEPNDKELST